MTDETSIPDDLRGQAVEMLVSQAESELETANTIAEALRHLVIPETFATDLYHPDETTTSARERAREEEEGVQKTNTEFPFESMVKLFLYRKVRDYSDNDLSDLLTIRTHLQRWFGVNRAPTQQTFSNTWNKRFSPQTQHSIEVVARAIATAAVDEGVIRETLAPHNLTDDDTDDDGMPKREYKRKQTNKTFKLVKKHGVPHFETGRADNKKYSDPSIFKMQGRMCATETAAYTEGQVGWLTDDDYTPDAATFLRAIKQVGQTHHGQQREQAALSDFEELDLMEQIAAIRDDVTRGFDTATENVIKSIEGEDVFDDRVTIGAIDITPEQFHPTPWADKEAGIAKEDFPPMVSGYKKDGRTKRGYKYATITLAGDVPPIILGVEPVKHSSKWEPDDALLHPNHEIVDRLLTKALQLTDIDIVLYDRGLRGDAVDCVVEEHGLTYVSPKQRYTDEWEDIESIQEHPTADGAVKHNVEVSAEVGEDHEAEQIYVPSRSDDEDGDYAIFVTNHGRVEPDEIHHWPNIYRRRWDIENQYKSIKSFLPRTSSTDFRVRFHNFVFAALVYNLWRLTDFLVKVAMDEDIRSKPVLTAKTFCRALGDFFREFG